VAYRYIARKKTAALTTEISDEYENPEALPDRRALAREGVRRFYAALAELSPTARIAFALHELDGRSVAEVATCVGASVTATKLRIWRARRQLEKRAAADPILSQFLHEETP
jgi:RNA polymerase sigma-70 factor (ECF subfamily)